MIVDAGAIERAEVEVAVNRFRMSSRAHSIYAAVVSIIAAFLLFMGVEGIPDSVALPVVALAAIPLFLKSKDEE